MTDDRIRCVDCRNLVRKAIPDLARRGDCFAAANGDRKDVSSRYGPAELELPRRCEFFLPMKDAEDQRDGRARFPTLWRDYELAQRERTRVHRDAAERGLKRAREVIA